MIETRNHGPLLLWSNYWDLEEAAAGKLYVSVNGGAIRVLVPPSMRSMIEECRSSKYAVLSRGPWPAKGIEEAIEIMWEDGTDSPYAVELTPNSFESLPAEPDKGREWVIALWDLKKGKPHKSLERVCHWRRVDKLPCLKPWEHA